MTNDGASVSHTRSVTPSTAFVYGNVYDKYNTTNPIARHLMRGFLQTVTGFVVQSGAKELHEVGCGEGRLAAIFAAQGYRVRGSDGAHEVVDIARRETRQAGLDIRFRVADIYHLDPDQDAAELILCCEVLEHLERPQQALNSLARVACPYLIASVPREPVWRVLNMLRGRYWRRLGNTPGHIQHWSQAAFLRLVESHFDVVAVAAPLPWTVALCRKRAAAGT